MDKWKFKQYISDISQHLPQFEFGSGLVNNSLLMRIRIQNVWMSMISPIKRFLAAVAADAWPHYKENSGFKSGNVWLLLMLLQLEPWRNLASIYIENDNEVYFLRKRSSFRDNGGCRNSQFSISSCSLIIKVWKYISQRRVSAFRIFKLLDGSISTRRVIAQQNKVNYANNI